MRRHFSGYPRILAVTDFSTSAEAALLRAVWVGQQTVLILGQRASGVNGSNHKKTKGRADGPAPDRAALPRSLESVTS
jgi:hypothetical protein